MQWDYIIVGAGSAGCAITYQLVKSGRKVLVLEAGGAATSPLIRFPLGIWQAATRFDWGFSSQPDRSRNGATDKWTRGRVLGGTSSINGMVYVRGAYEDFDRWAEKCDNVGGWSAKEVIPVFRGIESSDQTGSLRGRDGPIHVRTVSRPHKLTEAFVASGCAAGWQFNPDYNDVQQEGFGYLQFSQRRGMRWSSADAFLKPILGRSNLKILLNAEVHKLEIEKGRAVAVAFEHEGQLHREVAHDVVLSAGVINSPKLLMLSGIGNPDELKRVGIEPKIDLRAVGCHLKEHPLIALSYRSRVPTYNLTEGLMQKMAIAAKYVRHREGPMSAVYEGVAFLKTNPALLIPDIQVFFAPIGWNVERGLLRLDPYPAFKISIMRSHSCSSGQIRLADSNARSAPLIECPLLDERADLDTLVQGIETIRSILSFRPIADYISEEVSPGVNVQGKAALQKYITENTKLTCHPIGTCRMGIGPDAVVGPDLRVIGTENVWVADASIMPDHISANTNAVCMMIGAKLGKELVAGRSKAIGRIGSIA